MPNENRIALSKIRVEHAKENLETATENLGKGRYKATLEEAEGNIIGAEKLLIAIEKHI